MKHLELNGTLRVTGKKADVKSVRRNELVPCVIYGKDIENVSFSVEAKELDKLTNTPFAHVVDLDIEGKKYVALLHGVQYHPITDKAIHADFLAISLDKPVTVDVPIKIVGNSEGVKLGGKLAVSVRKLRINGLAEVIPNEIEIDITNLGLGKQISAADLSYDNFKIVSAKTTLICAVRMTRNAAAADAV